MTTPIRPGLRATTTRSSRPVPFALAIALLATGAPRSSSGDALTTLTLAEFFQLVDKGLPAQALQRAGLLDAEADVDQARELPELGVSLERQEVFVDGDGVVLQESVALGWSLDLSGRRGLRIDAANAGLRAARLRSRRAHALIALDAAAIYLHAARARLRLQSLEQSREPLAKLTESTSQRAEEGDASGADLARFELALSEHDDRLARAHAELEAAEARLAALLGRSGRTAAADDLALPRSPERSTNEPTSMRPDLRAADEELSGGRALIQAASRWWVPTLDLSVGYLTTDFGPGSGPDADVAGGYLASLSLSVPIFSRGQAERKRGQARVARAQAAKMALGRRAQAEMAAARAHLSSSLERARIHQQQRLVLAAVLVEKTESAYHGGEATALELRDAYEKSADTQLRAIDLRFEARMAELELLRALGTQPDQAPR